MTHDIRVVPNAILRPSQKGEKQGLRQTCGVFSQSGDAISEATVSARIGDLSLPCTCPDPIDLPRRTGRWLYCGIGFHHFGHALIFSTARLWALDHLEKPVDGILFIGRGTNAQTRPETTRHLTTLLATFGVKLPVWTLSKPEIVEELIVPKQGISTDENLFAGTHEYRQYIRNIIRLKPMADPVHKRVYISRTKLGFHKPGLIFEDRLEHYLEQEGYLIFHPQDHSIDNQIATYKSASHIIGVDGSAIHLAAFAADKNAKIAILARREFFADALADQATKFSGARAYTITAYGTVYAPKSAFRDGTLWIKTLCETQFPKLGDELWKLGFIETSQMWYSPLPKRISRRLARAAQHLNDDFIPVPPKHSAE